MPKRYLKAGDVITEDWLEWVCDSLEKLANLQVAQGGALQLYSGPDGHVLSLRRPRPVYLKLSGSASPYDWTEVTEAAGGTWTDTTATGTGNAYEVNGTSGLDGMIVRAWWTGAGDYRFDWPGHACHWTITVHNCLGTAESGATVTLSQSGVTIATGTTNGSGQVVFAVPLGTYDLTITPNGTGEETYNASGVSFSACGQSDTYTLAAGSSAQCVGCGGCAVIPSVLSLSGTGSHSCFVDTLTYDGSSGKWVGTYFTGACGGTGNNLMSVQPIPGTSVPNCNLLSGWFFAATSCSPFHAVFQYPNGGDTMYLDG